MGVEERKPRIGGSIPNDLSFCSPPLLFPLFPLTGSDSYDFAHITQDNNDKTSRPTTLDQQNSFLSASWRGGKLRLKGNQVCPVPFCKSEPGGGELETQEASGNLQAPAHTSTALAAHWGSSRDWFSRHGGATGI